MRKQVYSNYVISPGTSLLVNDTASEFTLNQCVSEEQNAVFEGVSKSVKLTSNIVGGGGFFYGERTGLTLNLVNAECIEYLLYIPNISQFTSVNCTLTDSTNKAAGLVSSILAASLTTGLNRVRLVKSEFNVASGFDWNKNITKVRWGFNCAAGQQPSVIIGPLVKDTQGKPKAVLTFDDGLLTTYTNAMPILDEFGLNACTCINGYTILNPSGVQMNLTQLHELDTKGWDVLSHGYQHINIATSDDATALNDINLNKQFLIDNGFTRAIDCFAYPNAGGYSPHAADLLKSVGYTAARTIIKSVQAHPPEDLMAIRSINPETNLASTLTAIDKAKKTGSTIFFYYHDIVETITAGNQTLIADLRRVVQTLVERKFEVLTMTEWKSGLKNTRLPISA